MGDDHYHLLRTRRKKEEDIQPFALYCNQGAAQLNCPPDVLLTKMAAFGLAQLPLLPLPTACM